jgi:soluble P-type ATPase
MKFQIPGVGELEINTIVLDLNGTISVAGQIVPGVKERLAELTQVGMKVILFTGNTRGDADELAAELGIDWQLTPDGAAKQEAASRLALKPIASIGNGLIDLGLTKVCKLRIVTLQAEGVHVQTLMNSDIIVPSINDALDLFLDSSRLIAGLRK